MTGLKNSIAIISFATILTIALSGCNEAATAVGALNDAKTAAQDELDVSNPVDLMEYMRAHALKNNRQEEEEVLEEMIADGIILISNAGYDASSQKKALLILDGDSELTKKSELEFTITKDGKEVFSHKAAVECEGSTYYAVLDFTKCENPLTGSLTVKDDPTVNADILIKRGLYNELFDEKLSSLIHSEKDYTGRDLSEQIEIVIELELICEYADNDIYRDEICGALKSYLDALSNESKENSGLKEDEKCAIAAMLSKGCLLFEEDGKKYLDRAKEIAKDIKGSSSAWNYCMAASLFRATGDNSYRLECEKMADKKEYRGLSYDLPGYIGDLSYVSSKKPDYSAAQEMIYSFIEDTNAYISDDVFTRVLRNETLDSSSLRMLPVVNEITESTQYIKFMQNAVSVMCGCNPDNEDLMDESEYGMLFVLSYLIR